MVRNKLPKPFNKIGRQGSYATDLIPVSDEHRVIFMWHDGPERTDRSFYGYLLCVVHNDDLYPIFEFHYHPSHKGLHCKTPCKTAADYRNRLLPRAPELNLKSHRDFDPRLESDRAELIRIFCQAVGVETPIRINRQGELWN
ncbi:hypothetical protein AWB77_00103 [Caballeronia fortuita]|uniref:Uncharacterized protein n=2 Tax=Caballeronia fortuita TaxID=1777138 RepID=A0A157Z1V4_9BURK|nr:hypothetical protein AWB77_00103 [Caballeronia fortuita]